MAALIKFNWDKLLSRFSDPAVLKTFNHIRTKGNEINGIIAKESKPLPPIDFASYSKRLQFTGAGVAQLEAVYKNTKIPQYTAELPAFEQKKRDAIYGVLAKSVEAAKQDLESLYKQRDEFETKVRVNNNTTMYDIQRRFPDIARSNEDEINQMLWFYNKETTRHARESAIQDNEDAHCKHDDSQYAGDYGYQFNMGCVPEVVGEDSYVAKDVKQYTGRVGPEPQ